MTQFILGILIGPTMLWLGYLLGRANHSASRPATQHPEDQPCVVALAVHDIHEDLCDRCRGALLRAIHERTR